MRPALRCSTALALLLCPMVTIGVATPAWAQTAEADEATEGEIVVTARKREERLTDVPLSIQAFSEETLRTRGTNDLNDLKREANFVFTPQSGSAAGGRAFGAMSCRGLIGTSGGYGESSCSLFVDGAYVATGLASVNTVGVERVEVLKGPQNTYFGRNTFGGAINFITRNPSDEFKGEFNGSITDLGSHDADLSVEGPLLGKKLTARVTVLSHQRPGIYTAADGGELGTEKTTSISGILFSQLSDAFWMRARASYQEDRDGPAAFAFLPGRASFGNSCVGVLNNVLDRNRNPSTSYASVPYYCGKVPSMADVGSSIVSNNTTAPTYLTSALAANTYVSTDPTLRQDSFIAKVPLLRGQGLARDIQRYAAQAGLDLPGGYSLAANVGYTDTRQMTIWDVDKSNTQNFTAAQAMIGKDFTADLRFATDANKPLRALLGVSYYWGSYQVSQIDANDMTAGPVIIQTGTFSNDRGSVPAVYGSVDWEFIPGITVTAEGRYQADTISFTTRPTSTLAAVEYKRTFKSFLPRFILKFEPARNTNIYASYAQGVQPAFVNNGFINATAVQKQELIRRFPNAGEYSPLPELDSYELGWKQQMFGNRLSFAIDGYYMKWKNMSGISAAFNEPGQTLLPISGLSVRNTNNARIWGIEASVDARITRKWDFAATLNYTNAEWTQYENSTFALIAVLSGRLPTDPLGTRVPILDGKQISRVPRWSGTISSGYKDDLAGDWSWFVRGDASYTGSTWESDLNLAKLSAYWRVNARIGLEREGISIELFSTNLFNDKNWDSGFRITDLSLTPMNNYTQQGIAVAPPTPRQIGLRVRTKF